MAQRIGSIFGLLLALVLNSRAARAADAPIAASITQAIESRDEPRMIDVEAARRFWSYQPIAHRGIPAVKDAA